MQSRDSEAILLGHDQLEDILDLGYGPHLFILVKAQYQPTCLGSSVEYLCNCVEPSIAGRLTHDATRVLSLPKEIWRLINYLYGHAMQEVDLFKKVPPASCRVARVRACVSAVPCVLMSSCVSVCCCVCIGSLCAML